MDTEEAGGGGEWGNSFLSKYSYCAGINGMIKQLVAFGSLF